MAVQRGTGKADTVDRKLTEQYEFQVMYMGYVDAESADEAHEKVGKLLDLTKRCLSDVIIHKLDQAEKSRRLMFAASRGVEHRAQEEESAP